MVYHTVDLESKEVQDAFDAMQPGITKQKLPSGNGTADPDPKKRKRNRSGGRKRSAQSDSSEDED